MAPIEWTKDALKDLEKVDKGIARRIIRKISWLSDNYDYIVPETLSATFKGTYKLRVGDYRVIYTIDNKTIVIQMIGHRKEIYKDK